MSASPSRPPAGVRPADLLADLHRQLLEGLGGSRSVVLQRTASGSYRALSGRGVSELAGVWLDGEDARALDELLRVRRGACVAQAAEVPALARRLEAPVALLIPIAPARARATAVAVALAAPPDPAATRRAEEAAAGFEVALDLSRLTREVHFHQRLRELFLLFSREVPSTLSLPAALESLTHEINSMLGTGRATVWLHDRRARELALVSSSDGGYAAAGGRVSTEDAAHPAARGLRLERAEFVGDVLVSPLRGWRRALGTLVLEGAAATDLDEEQLLDLAHELGRQLSVGIENIQLLDEVLRQRRLLEDTFNSLVDLVAVMDTDLRVVQTNEAFAARTGLARASLIGRGIDELVGPDTAAWVSAADPRHSPAPAGTSPVEDHRLGGTFLLTATPLINQEGHAVGRVLVARDITRQTRLEAERAVLRGRLAQSEKLASLGQFVAGIAHEMNNPLQGVLGHLELMMETSEPARPLRRELRRIYQDADRAAKIVRNLLVFTGSRRMARRRLQIDRVVARAIASRSASLQRGGIELVRQHEEHLPPVLGDPLLLQQALLNILINAEHAVGQDSGGDRRIEVSTRTNPARERVTVAIRDTGPGISPEVLGRIFDPFFTTKEVGKGTGLGLAITYGIIQEHGGTIIASNAPGGGAVFEIELPAAQEVIK